MEGKTVIAIAHRLSTIARMDRLVVIEQGRIVESGTHEELLRLGGHYEKLWRHQSGGFLADDFFAATSRKTRLAGSQRGSARRVAACAHAQETRFAFATQAEARAALGAQDDYVRATSTLERPVVMGTAEVMDTEPFRAAMEATALEWTEDERRPFAGVLARLGPFRRR